MNNEMFTKRVSGQLCRKFRFGDDLTYLITMNNGENIGFMFYIEPTPSGDYLRIAVAKKGNTVVINNTMYDDVLSGRFNLKSLSDRLETSGLIERVVIESVLILINSDIRSRIYEVGD